MKMPSTPGTAAISAAAASPSAVSTIGSSNGSVPSVTPSDVRAAPVLRPPAGGRRIARTSARASSADSTPGTMTPCTPASTSLPIASAACDASRGRTATSARSATRSSGMTSSRPRSPCWRSRPTHAMPLAPAPGDPPSGRPRSQHCLEPVCGQEADPEAAPSTRVPVRGSGTQCGGEVGGRHVPTISRRLELASGSAVLDERGSRRQHLSGEREDHRDDRRQHERRQERDAQRDDEPNTEPGGRDVDLRQPGRTAGPRTRTGAATRAPPRPPGPGGGPSPSGPTPRTPHATPRPPQRPTAAPPRPPRAGPPPAAARRSRPARSPRPPHTRTAEPPRAAPSTRPRRRTSVPGLAARARRPSLLRPSPRTQSSVDLAPRRPGRR